MSITRLPEFDLGSDTELSGVFRSLALTSYRAAAGHVWRLPYGRNSYRGNYALVLKEGCGTCSTKHALLAALAREHDQPVELRLGIYEMDALNTPGVGEVLLRNRISSIPEAHCYLAYRDIRIDLTRSDATTSIGPLLHEETIEPEGIGDHKLDLHR